MAIPLIQNPAEGLSAAQLARFHQYIGPVEENGCRLWLGSVDKKGYAVFSRWPKQNTRVASRIAWALFKGPIPTGMLVCHACDNPPCVNVDHFFLGTNADNQCDKMLKGRNPLTKIPPGIVNQIRDLHRIGWGHLAIAEKIGTLENGYTVSSHAVFNIVKRGQHRLVPYSPSCFAPADNAVAS